MAQSSETGSMVRGGSGELVEVGNREGGCCVVRHRRERHGLGSGV